MINQFYLTHRWDLIGTTTPGQSGPGSNGNEVVFYIPQIFGTGTSPSTALESYLGHSFMGQVSYSSAEKRSAYSTAPADRTVYAVKNKHFNIEWQKDSLKEISLLISSYFLIYKVGQHCLCRHPGYAINHFNAACKYSQISYNVSFDKLYFFHQLVFLTLIRNIDMIKFHSE